MASTVTAANGDGVWATLGEVRTTLELARSGFGWIGIDAQHGGFDDRSIRELFALRPDDAATMIVRVAAADPAPIGRALDAGADGIIVPLVESPEQAERVVSAAHYPPRGSRSWGPLPGSRPRGHAAGDGSGPFCAVMIETADGLRRVAEIAATPQLDMIFVGPFDLALALGIDVDELLADADPRAPLPSIARACADAGILAGAYAGSPERARTLRAHGFSWVAVATDAGVLHLGASAARVVE